MFRWIGRPPQFSLATLLWAMIAASVLAAALGGVLTEFGQSGRSARYIVFLALLAGMPLAMLLLLSLGRAAAAGLRRERRRKRGPAE